MESKQDFIYNRIINLVNRGYRKFQLNLTIDPVEY